MYDLKLKILHVFNLASSNVIAKQPSKCTGVL